jgi:precorrin-6B methylase 1
METMFIRPKSLTQDLTPQAIARITAKARVNNSRFVVVELLPGPGEEVAIQAWQVL